MDLYPFGGGNPPVGEQPPFLSATCATVQGAVIPDPNGTGNLPQGPGCCAPDCRMAPPAREPNGANGLPVCDASFKVGEPRATVLQAP